MAWYFWNDIVWSSVMVNSMCQLSWIPTVFRLLAKCQLGCAVNMFFFGEINIQISRLWVKQIICHNVGGPHTISWRPVETKTEVLPGRSNSASRYFSNSSCNINPSLDLQPVGLPCPSNFLKFLSLSCSLCVYVYIHVHIHIHILLVCFSRELWLTRMPSFTL